MSDKDPSFLQTCIDAVRSTLPFVITIWLACWGGIVNHLVTLRKMSKKFRFRELLVDLIISSFAGLLTYFFCQHAGLGDSMAAVLIAISGHMGTRAIAGFEAVYNRLLGVRND